MVPCRRRVAVTAAGLRGLGPATPGAEREASCSLGRSCFGKCKVEADSRESASPSPRAPRGRRALDSWRCVSKPSDATAAHASLPPPAHASQALARPSPLRVSRIERPRVAEEAEGAADSCWGDQPARQEFIAAESAGRSSFEESAQTATGSRRGGAFPLQFRSFAGRSSVRDRVCNSSAASHVPANDRLGSEIYAHQGACGNVTRLNNCRCSFKLKFNCKDSPRGFSPRQSASRLLRAALVFCASVFVICFLERPFVYAGSDAGLHEGVESTRSTGMFLVS